MALDRHIDKWNETEDSRNKTVHLCSTYFWQRYQENSVGERIVGSTNGAGINGYPHRKDEVRSPTSHHIQNLIQNGPRTYM